MYITFTREMFSNEEEDQSKSWLNGGEMKFYPQTGLSKAGGNFDGGDAWKSKMVTDRELITGQNPASAMEVANEILKRLSSKN